MVNIIICDDNQKDKKNVLSIVNNFVIRNKLEHEIFLYDDYDDSFLSIIDKKLPFKIYLLDIVMPTRSGIDIAREIRKKDMDSVIIFFTAHEELGNVVLKNDLMFLSFVNKFDDMETRLLECLNKALDVLNQRQVIKFNDRNVSYTINIKDILYVTKDSFERKTIIKTDYTEFRINKSLSEIVDMLDGRFVQTHRACYINIDRKISIDRVNRIITFDNGDTIDLLSDKFRKEIVK